MLRVLLLHRLRLWRNQTFRGARRLRRILALLLSLVLGLAFAGLVYQFSLVLLALLARVDPALPGASLSFVFVGVIVLALLSAVGAVLHQLYLASDLDLLLAAPVSLRDLFLLKLMEAWFAASFGGLLGLAVLAGYGRALDLPPPFWPLALLVTAAAALVAAATAMVMVMLAIRVMPARRAEGIVALLGGALVAVVWLLFQAANVGGRRNSPWQPDQAQMRDLEPVILQWSETARWTPAGWAADALVAAGRGDWPAAALALALLGGATAGVCGLAYLLFRRTFYLGWGRLREVAPRGVSSRRRGSPLPRLLRPLPAPVRAVVLKDWRTLPRDLKLLSGLIMPLAMLAFFGFTAVQGQPAGLHSPAGFWLGMLPVSLIPFLLGSGLSSRAFGIEGRNFALLRTAPLTIGQMMVAKLVAGFVPVLALAWAAAIALGIGLGGSAAQVATALGVSAWLTAGVVTAYVGGGMLSTNFEADNPLRSVGCLGQALSFLAASLFLLANAGLFAYLVLASSGTLPFGPPTVYIVGLVLAVGAVMSVAVIAGLAWFGARTLAGWEGR